MYRGYGPKLKLHMWTTKWRYNDVKYVFAYNSHNPHRTLEILTSSCSLDQAESQDIGPAHFHKEVYSQYRAMCKTNFFKLVLGCATELHETW